MLEHHPLVKELPELRELMHRLKVEDPEFRALFEEYHRLDRRIYRIEQDLEPVSDELCAKLKRRRLYLEDRLVEMMREARSERGAPGRARRPRRAPIALAGPRAPPPAWAAFIP